MFKQIISSKKYWRSVLLLGVGFMIVFSIAEHLMQYGGLAYETFRAEKINNGLWVRYATSRIVGGFLYGMILGYYFELRKLKDSR